MAFEHAIAEIPVTEPCVHVLEAGCPACEAWLASMPKCDHGPSWPRWQECEACNVRRILSGIRQNLEEAAYRRELAVEGAAFLRQRLDAIRKGVR